MLMPPTTKGISTHETDTWNIAGRRTWVSDDALAWASNIVKRAWQQLQNAFEAEGKAEWLEVLRPFVAGGGKTPLSQEEAAAKLGVPIATLRTRLSHLRQRHREALRTEVANAVWLSKDQLRNLSDEILS